MLSWEFNEKTYEHKKQQFLKSSEDIGDVHSVYLPYLERFIKDIPDIKIVCTRRSSEEVANSFENHIDRDGVLRNHWYNHKGRYEWQLDPEWDHTFPKYDIKNRKQAILQYARDYDKKVDELVKKYPENIMLVHIDELSTISSQNKILKFVGIKMYNRRYKTGHNSVYNSSKHLKKT